MRPVGNASCPEYLIADASMRIYTYRYSRSDASKGRSSDIQRRPDGADLRRDERLSASR